MKSAYATRFQAIAAAQAIDDDRGYQAWAGIHGLPLPISCVHHRELFLPWHRAYLYFFEKALQDRVPGVTLPWWDWTVEHAEGIPAAYAARKVKGRKNPLFDSPIQRSGRETPGQAVQLENIHDGVHVWTGGTMGSIAVAAYDPIFYAHHCMIDRHGPGVPAALLDRAPAERPFDRADLIFYGLDHSGPSYEAQVFMRARGDARPRPRRGQGHEVLAFRTIRLATYA